MVQSVEQILRLHLVAFHEIIPLRQILSLFDLARLIEQLLKGSHGNGLKLEIFAPFLFMLDDLRLEQVGTLTLQCLKMSIQGLFRYEIRMQVLCDHFVVVKTLDLEKQSHNGQPYLISFLKTAVYFR